VYLTANLFSGKLPILWNVNYNWSGFQLRGFFPQVLRLLVHVQWSGIAAAAAQCVSMDTFM
jgi:hypothetical protein